MLIKMHMFLLPYSCDMYGTVMYCLVKPICCHYTPHNFFSYFCKHGLEWTFLTKGRQLTFSDTSIHHHRGGSLVHCSFWPGNLYGLRVASFFYIIS